MGDALFLLGLAVLDAAAFLHGRELGMIVLGLALVFLGGIVYTDTPKITLPRLKMGRPWRRS